MRRPSHGASLLTQSRADDLKAEVDSLRQALTDALERQTATGEILEVIRRSPGDLQPVFDTIARNAVRVCDGLFAAVLRVEGDQLHLAAHDHFTPAGLEAMNRMFPSHVTADTVAARAVRARAVVHIPDTERDPTLTPASRELARTFGYRSLVIVPLLRDGEAIGTLNVSRRHTPFSDHQIRLLQTFAVQAVIVIENVRRFNETKEALEQQTATAEVLRVISRSQTDVQPVFDTMVRSAVRLCDATFCMVTRFDGELIHLVADHNFTPEAREIARRVYPTPLTRQLASARAILDRAVCHIPDVEMDGEYDPSISRDVGSRSVLAVPIFRDGNPIGAIAVGRAIPGPFSPKQIELLQTFAAQAVIAIENVRLFNETKEALEQQTATAEILRVISGSPTDLQPVMDVVAESAARFCGATDVAVLRLEGESLRLVAAHGPHPSNLPIGGIIAASPGAVVGRAVCDRQTIHIEDLLALPEEFPETVARTRRASAPTRTVLATPLLREGVPIGVIGMRRVEIRPFTDKQIELAKTFAHQAVIAIENVRLFTELQEKNRALTAAHAQVTEALDRQTATSEILQVISQSPIDTEPVFETIAQNALRLCEGGFAVVARFDGELLHLAAHAHARPEGVDVMRQAFPMRPSRINMSGRAILTGTVAHVVDAMADLEHGQHFTATLGNRSSIGVPMLRDGRPIGAIMVGRLEVRPFSENEVALLQTFAAQAVIAIENVRLFKELADKNRALTESLEQQTATADILQVIPRSPTEVQPVFEAVVTHAARLCEAQDVAMLLVDGDHLRSAAGVGPLYRSLPSDFRIRVTRGSAATRAVVDRATVHIHDFAAESEEEYPVGRELARRFGHRSMLAVPLLREGAPIGVICAFRMEVRPFPDQQIALLQTFADQAVIAIENVRLFNELKEKNGALTEALERQTATAEILRVISSSPTDLQPVFDTIVRNAVRLCGAAFGGLHRLDGTRITLDAQFGMLADEFAFLQREIFPLPLSRGSVAGRAILDGAAAHIRDIRDDPDFRTPRLKAMEAYRTVLAVPLIREGLPIGALPCGAPRSSRSARRKWALSRPSPIRRSSRSRTCACSRNCRRGRGR